MAVFQNLVYQPYLLQTEVLLNGILRLVDWTYNSFLDVLELLTYARVNPLYTDSKAVACCKAAQFAYNEWCATTAYGERCTAVHRTQPPVTVGSIAQSRLPSCEPGSCMRTLTTSARLL